MDPLTGTHAEHAAAQTVKLFIDGSLGAGTECDHRNHGSNTDDDAEHRQKCAEKILTDRLCCDAKHFSEHHDRFT